VAETPRPLDPDDLPIDAIQTPEERELAASLPARAYGSASVKADRSAGLDAEPTLHPRPLSLKALAGRILGQRDN
jgi:hypothetical protein